MKKIRNYIIEIIYIFWLKLLKKYPWSKEMNLKDFFSQKINFNYISNKLGFIFKFKRKIGTFHIDGTLVNSELCQLGKNHSTDKSPFNESLHRHPYTPIYSLLFSSLKNKKINFAEIGILNNSSIRMWRDFFPYAYIFGFDYDDSLILNAKKDKLKKVFYKKINVKKSSSIIEAFKSCKKKFDVIIDDSSHNFYDQIRIIKETTKYLKPGGVLVIEDIPKENSLYSEENFNKHLKKQFQYFDFFNFIDCDHINKFSKGWNNDKLLIMVKNNQIVKK